MRISGQKGTRMPGNGERKKTDENNSDAQIDAEKLLITLFGLLEEWSPTNSFALQVVMAMSEVLAKQSGGGCARGELSVQDRRRVLARRRS
jgi:hypothetical protein